MKVIIKMTGFSIAVRNQNVYRMLQAEIDARDI